ncbi:unnamed protein product [Agarophyton chilense]
MDTSQHTRFLASPLAIAASPELRANAAANASRIRELEGILHTKRRELERLHCAKRLRSRSISPPLSASSTPITSSPRSIDYIKQTPREMAARGSHWSFAEKARFEAALHRYGPFAWDHIIRAVGTRSEKQVKAYAARYRRRKKLAAKAQQEAVRAFAAAQLNAAAAAAAAVATATANRPFGMGIRSLIGESKKTEPRLAPIMPADFRTTASVHLRSPSTSSLPRSVSGADGQDVNYVSTFNKAKWMPDCAPDSALDNALDCALDCAPDSVPAHVGDCAPTVVPDGTPDFDADIADCDQVTDGDSGGTEMSMVDSGSNDGSNDDSNDESTACAFFGADVEQQDGLADMMGAAVELRCADGDAPFDCAMLEGGGTEWKLTDGFDEGVLEDGLLQAAF